MDLRVYYQNIRKLEAEIPDATVVIISRETPDGGKAGVRTDVPRRLAARLVVEGRAELANAEEAEQFRAEVERKWKAAEQDQDVAGELLDPFAASRPLRRGLRPGKKL